MKGSRHLFRISSKLGSRAKPSFTVSLVNIVRSCSTASDQHVFHSKYSNVNIPEISFGKYMLEKFEKYASRPALVNGDTQEIWSFKQLRDNCLGLSKSLAKLDISSGDTIAIFSPNCPEYFPSIVGPALLGANVTTINSTYSPEEISKQLMDSEAQVVICHFALYGLLKKALEGNTNIRHVITIGKNIGHGVPIEKLFTENGHNFSQSVQVDPEDMLLLPYSSGTTGLPKGVMLSHKNIVANLEQIMHPELSATTSDRQETFIGLLPMFHSYGLTACLFVSAALGGRLVTVSKFDAPQYVGFLTKYKPTFVHTVPTVLAFLIGNNNISSDMLSDTHTVMSGAAPVGDKLVNLFNIKFGGKISYQEGYGMTEASPVTHMTPRSGYVGNSSGTSIPNTSTKIIDIETTEMISNGDPGELCVKGPQVMKGYYKNPEATSDILSSDGWLRTGDLAKMDKNGNIFIIDRLKELIKVKGLQVAPAELENVLRKHPAVADVAVVGVPHDRSGEVPRAYIVPKQGVKFDVADIIEFHDAKVAPHKKLDGGIEMIAELPKSATGKVLRRVLNGASTSS